MKNDSVGGGHPEYKVLLRPVEGRERRARRRAAGLYYTIAKMVDACAANGLKAFYGPFGDFSDAQACEASPASPFCWAAPAPGRSTLANRNRQAGLQPGCGGSRLRQRILDAMPHGSGAVMIDGKMQDDATWKQAKVIVDLARTVAGRDPELASAYGL